MRRCFGKAAAACDVCVNSGQVGPGAHVRDFESRRQTAPDTSSAAGSRRSPSRRDGSTSRPLQQSGANTFAVPPSANHEHSQQTHFEVSTTLDIGAVCRATRFCSLAGARVFNAGLLPRSQFASGRSCDRPTRSRFSLVPERMLSWYPNSTMLCMLLVQPSKY
jgi:hypothetical protein